MSLIKYALKRILALIPILFLVLLVTFVLSREMPGSPFLREGEKVNLAAAAMKAEDLGLNKPVYMQFLLYMRNILQGNWGKSISYQIPVWDYIKLRLPVTFELAIISTLISAILGIWTGVFSAVNKNTWKDTIVRFIALVGVSVPVFWLGMVLKYYLAIKLDLFPTYGYMYVGIEDELEKITGFGMIDSLITGRFDLFFDIIWHMFLPIFCLTFITVAGITRQARSSMLEVLELDYVRSARAKGCKEKDVINKHALRNALIPTVTVIGLHFGGILAGAVLTETTFALNGFGTAMVNAIRQSDYFVINALVILTTFLFIVVNLITDILYAILDPRIRY